VVRIRPNNGQSIDDSIKSKGILAGLKGDASIDEVVGHLRNVYTKNVGVEIMHVADPAEKEWLAEHVESSLAVELSAEEKKRIHQLMYESELFDLFMQTKFRSVKRYALEGCESMMPAVDALFATAAEYVVGFLYSFVVYPYVCLFQTRYIRCCHRNAS